VISNWGYEMPKLDFIDMRVCRPISKPALDESILGMESFIDIAGQEPNNRSRTLTCWKDGRFSCRNPR